MKINFLRNYRKVETGNMVYVYTVSGTQKDLAAFEAAQGDKHTVDEETGAPLWFSTRYVGDKGNLAISRNGKVFADTSEFDKASSLCEQHKGTALGDQLARVMAEKLLAGFGNSSSPVQAPQTKGEDISKL